MEAIRTEGLTKKFRDMTAVDGLNLTVHEGELFSLLGVNGAGKTTTIRMLSCLLEPTSGDAFELGKSVVKEADEVKRFINISPQETAVARNLSVRENLELMAKLYGANNKEAAEMAELEIQNFDLRPVANKRSQKLSGGMQRRLSIAMALISKPKILFLDEPTIGLDVLARRELWKVIEGLKGTMTVILTTHYMEEAEVLSDRTGIMAGGKLKTVGTPGELMTLTGSKSLEEAFVKIASEAGEVK